MSASRRPALLDPEDLRTQVAANKLVRVAVAPSAQFPEGTVGRVRRVGDPASDGDEFVFVEVTMDGTKDVVPFALSDLGPTGARGKAAKPAARPTVKAVPAEPVATTRPMPRPAVSGPPPAAPAPSTRAAAAPPADGPAGTPTRPAESRPAESRPAARSTTKQAKRSSPPVTVTLMSTEEPGQWRVDAKVGTRSVVKAATVPAARLWDMVQLLDSPPLAEAVRSHLDEQRRVAGERAARLRAELEAVQAELAALPDAD